MQATAAKQTLPEGRTVTPAELAGGWSSVLQVAPSCSKVTDRQKAEPVICHRGESEQQRTKKEERSWPPLGAGHEKKCLCQQPRVAPAAVSGGRTAGHSLGDKPHGPVAPCTHSPTLPNSVRGSWNLRCQVWGFQGSRWMCINYKMTHRSRLSCVLPKCMCGCPNLSSSVCNHTRK
jgi:hypothetical protein